MGGEWVVSVCECGCGGGTCGGCGVGGSDDSRHGESILARADDAPN